VTDDRDSATDSGDATDSQSGSQSGSPSDGPSVGTSQDGSADGESKRKRKQLPLWQETILLLTLAVVLAVVIKAFFVQSFYIPSESMEPGLIKNDRIIVEKMSYWGSGSPQRGDVVVFRDPGQWLSLEADAGPANPIGKVLAKVGLYPAGGNLVKRVIGLPGDTIHCCDTQGRILVNGHPLDEKSYVLEAPGMKCNGPEVHTCNWTAGPVPAGKLFMMGDNRSDSADWAKERVCQTNRAPGNRDPVVERKVRTGRGSSRSRTGDAGCGTA
jgi:signal peptidase I